MKNLFKFVFIIAFLTGGLAFGQDDRPTLSPNAEKLYSSEGFKNFVLTDYNLLFKHEADKEFVLKLKDDSSIVNESNIEESSKKLGFLSAEDMSNNYTKLYEAKNSFEKEFSLKDFSTEDISAAATEIVYDYLETQISMSKGKNPQCWKKYKRCIAISAGTGYGVHVGCLGVDWSIVGGVVCHGVAFGTAWLMMESCEDDYVSCK